MKRRILALLAATSMLFSLVACTQGEQNGDQSQFAADGKLFSEDTTIKLMVHSDASFPYKESWPMWRLFREKTGANLEVLAIPTEMATKINLTMAGPREDMPDMSFIVAGKDLANSHGPAGGFIALSDNFDKMPNYKAFWEKIPEEERRETMLQRMAGDGKIYLAPNYGIQTIGNTRTWMYRKDIFEKHGLTAPETMDELYTVAKKLKELYPESYPLCIRSGVTNFKYVMGSSWGPYFSIEPYYNFDEGTWHFGVFEPQAKEMVEFFKKMVDEKLLMPDFLSISSTTWEQYVSNGMGFMMPEYLLRMDFFNVPAKETNPDFMLDAMMPPRATSEKGQNKIANLSYELTGYTVWNTGDQKRIDNALKLLDWMYSPEGIEFQSWGEEGVTYEVVDGKRKWLVGEFESPYTHLGLGTPGLYQVVETEANEALYTEEQDVAGEFARPFQEDRSNPYNFLSFPEEIATEVSDLKLELVSYIDAMLTKFITGLEPMEKWDAFLAELKKMGADDLLKAYETRYAEALELDIAG